jgi:hypothetical protein
MPNLKRYYGTPLTINNTFIWVVAIIFIWTLKMACVNKSKGNPILAFFHWSIVMGKSKVGCIDDQSSMYG